MYVNRGSITAIGIIFPILAVLAMIMRVYGLRYYSRKFELDDILVIPAVMLNIAAGAALVIGAQMEIIGGHSYPVISETEQERLGKFEYAFWIGHILAIGFIKLTILFLFRRIFRGQTYRTAFDYANWTIIFFVTLWTLVFLFFEIFACGATPAASWLSLQSLRHACVDTFGMQTGGAVFSWILDLTILIEPLLMIRTLNMSTKRKIQTSLVFLCSIFAVTAGLLRMIPWIQIHIQDISHVNIRVLGTTLPTADQEGIVSIILFWTYVEIGIGFLVACLPRSAWIFDKISLTPIIYKLRSLASTTSISQWERGPDPKRGKERNYSQASWISTRQPKESPSRHTDDEIELVAARST
ncbi:uncharacterized protein F4807DRAFT_449047 [Annulohypoxylon truncatum]|uniref:uncharacterized protein n=1 Tax=Annulohypoxylon truncatum TaxID=327061 RepID=UPI0020089CD3|nr:uncharacterized protein F4807DRAFT_449047 [Annulohypoxylon truncatum]KAI1204064.1 hypothetical protein F4807DRAFT_449047 [Annulohypoxylon truncatum]